MTNGFICNNCKTQFFSAAVESMKNCPSCKNWDISKLTPEEEKTKWVCNHCGTELFNNANFAGVLCINCKIGRMGPSPAANDIDEFLKELDEEMSAFEAAMGLEPGDLSDDNLFVGLEKCDDCAEEDCGAINPELMKRHIFTQEEIKEKIDKMSDKILKANQETRRKMYKPTQFPKVKKYTGPKVNRGPKEYCRWCTHWTRKAECYGYCRKHDVVRNAFQHCINFFRNQWAKDKITRW